MTWDVVAWNCAVGRLDLQMIVYNPAIPVDREQIRSLIEGTPIIAAQ